MTNKIEQSDVERQQRMEKIAKQHDLAGCQTDDCELCAEYYLLLKATYERVQEFS